MCQPGNHEYACFLKTPVSLQFSDLYFDIIFSEKSVYLRERERERLYELPPFLPRFSIKSEACVRNHDVTSSLLRKIM